MDVGAALVGVFAHFFFYLAMSLLSTEKRLGRVVLQEFVGLRIVPMIYSHHPGSEMIFFF